MKIKGFKLLVGDIVIVALIVILSVVIFVFTLPKDSANNTLEIYLNGELTQRIALKDGTSHTINIDELVHNTIEIDGTRVRITHSTCYDHVCENAGYISRAGEVIVCMPNKLLLKIVGNEKEYDMVVG